MKGLTATLWPEQHDFDSERFALPFDFYRNINHYDRWSGGEDAKMLVAYA